MCTTYTVCVHVNIYIPRDSGTEWCIRQKTAAAHVFCFGNVMTSWLARRSSHTRPFERTAPRSCARGQRGMFFSGACVCVCAPGGVEQGGDGEEAGFWLWCALWLFLAYRCERAYITHVHNRTFAALCERRNRIAREQRTRACAPQRDVTF